MKTRYATDRSVGSCRVVRHRALISVTISRVAIVMSGLVAPISLSNEYVRAKTIRTYWKIRKKIRIRTDYFLHHLIGTVTTLRS